MHTNHYVLDRLNSFSGEVRILNSSGSEFHIAREFKHIIRGILKEAGKTKPALCRFEIRNGIGYLIPQAPPQEGGDSNTN